MFIFSFNPLEGIYLARVTANLPDLSIVIQLIAMRHIERILAMAFSVIISYRKIKLIGNYRWEAIKLLK